VPAPSSQATPVSTQPAVPAPSDSPAPPPPAPGNLSPTNVINANPGKTEPAPAPTKS
jgi:hypothetical protein